MCTSVILGDGDDDDDDDDDDERRALTCECQ